jgi:SAM-dependent methyltransferase
VLAERSFLRVGARVVETRACEVCGTSRFSKVGVKNDHCYERCTSCGLERIHPPPTDATLASIYGEHYYDAWGLSRDAKVVERLKRTTFTRIINAAGKLSPGAKILDLGAATGFLMLAARDLGYDAYGVELSEYGAHEIASKFGETKVFQGELDQANFAGATRGSFSAVFMCDYIEHVRNPEAVLRLALEWLAPGGKLVITTPRIGSLTHRFMGFGWTHYKTEHLYYFSQQSLGLLLRKCGFADYRGTSLVKTMHLE